MSTALIASIVLALTATCCSAQKSDTNQGDTDPMATHQPKPTEASLQAIPFQTIDGRSASLADYAGQVVLIVNVASQCGYTKQYAGLEELYRKYKDSGLVVVGFPANNFGGQEPGSNEEILQFCQSRFEVTFPMMAKISVKGGDQHPLFKAMTEQAELGGEIKWNFSKFLIDRNGRLTARFDSAVTPMSDELVGTIRKLL